MAAEAAVYCNPTTQTCRTMRHCKFHLDIRYHTAAERITSHVLEANVIRLDTQIVENIIKVRQSTDKVRFASLKC